MSRRMMIAAVGMAGLLAQAAPACTCGRSVCTCEIEAKRRASETPTRSLPQDGISITMGDAPPPATPPRARTARDDEREAAAAAKRARKAKKAAAIAERARR